MKNDKPIHIHIKVEPQSPTPEEIFERIAVKFDEAAAIAEEVGYSLCAEVMRMNAAQWRTPADPIQFTLTSPSDG